MLLGFGWLRHLRAAGFDHQPRQCPRPGRRVDRAAGQLASGRAGSRRSWPAASSPGCASRRSSSMTPTCASTAGSCSSLTRQVRYLRGTANDARDGLPRLQARIALVYAVLCMAEQIGHLRGATQAPGQRARAPDPARRRPHQPQSRRHHRDPARPPAAEPGLHRAQRGAAAGADQRHRPHDADAALLPPRRRHLRPVQRHGPDAARPARHRARL